MDLKSYYWQIEIDKRDKEKSTFIRQGRRLRVPSNIVWALQVSRNVPTSDEHCPRGAQEVDLPPVPERRRGVLWLLPITPSRVDDCVGGDQESRPLPEKRKVPFRTIRAKVSRTRSQRHQS